MAGKGDDAGGDAGQGRDGGAPEEPLLLGEHRDRGERDRDLQEGHRHRELLVRMQRALGLLVERVGLRVEALGLLHDVGLLARVALGLGLVGLDLRRIGGKARRELRQVLLHALGLVVVPLVGGLGLLEHRLVLVVERLVLRVAAVVAHDRADGGEDRREDGDALPEAPLLGLVLDFVIVGAVVVRSVSGHSLRCLSFSRWVGGA
jgi:hypothetical protein